MRSLISIASILLFCITTIACSSGANKKESKEVSETTDLMASAVIHIDTMDFEKSAAFFQQWADQYAGHQANKNESEEELVEAIEDELDIAQSALDFLETQTQVVPLKYTVGEVLVFGKKDTIKTVDLKAWNIILYERGKTPQIIDAIDIATAYESYFTAKK